MVNVIIGFLPGIIWLIPFVLYDRKVIIKDYKRLVLLFLLGGIGSYCCYRLEMHFGSYFKKTSISNYLEILFYAICGVAIFEEGYKWILLLFSNFKSKKNNMLNIIYRSTFISIGFATLENILYYATVYGYKTSFSRIGTAFVSHIANGLWMGCFMGKVYYGKKKKIIYYILSFIVPVIFHALYNSFLYGDRKYGEYFLYFYIMLIISTIILIIILVRGDKKDGIRERY